MIVLGAALFLGTSQYSYSAGTVGEGECPLVDPGNTQACSLDTNSPYQQIWEKKGGTGYNTGDDACGLQTGGGIGFDAKCDGTAKVTAASE